LEIYPFAIMYYWFWVAQRFILSVAMTDRLESHSTKLQYHN